MKINAAATANVLTAFIQEDRAETRIYRNRVQQMSYVLVVASLTISAFLIGSVHLGTSQLRFITLLVDVGIVVIMAIVFTLVMYDLIWLRRAIKARQDLLYQVSDERTEDINVFPAVDKVRADVHDTDLYYLVVLSALVVLAKAAVVCKYAAFFVVGKATP